MKKLLSLTLALVTLLAFATLSAGAVEADLADTGANYLVSANEFETITAANAKVYGFIGDTDGDDDISVIDATQIQLYMAKLATLDSTAVLLADTDRDGDVSVIDATAIQLYMAKLPTSAKVAHTLYEITGGTTTGNEAQQVANYLKANGEYDADLSWYIINEYSAHFNFGLIYDVEDNKIMISLHTSSEDYSTSSSVFLTSRMEKDEYDYNSFLAKRYENDECVYDAYGKISQLKSTDTTLSLESYDFNSETLTFEDVEPEIQELITLAMSTLEEVIGDSIDGNLYSLFA